MKRIAFGTLAVLILLAGTIAFVPGVRAAVLENVKGWFEYAFPSKTTIVSLSTNWGFSPYNPGYIPDGLEIRGTMVEGDQATDTLGLCYQPERREEGDSFIAIVQKYMQEPESLPTGKSVSIGGVTGRIDELPAGEIGWCLGPSSEEELARVSEGGSNSPEQFPADEPLAYKRALRLTCIMDDVKIEIFGTYSEEELIRIAESLQQAELAAPQPERP